MLSWPELMGRFAKSAELACGKTEVRKTKQNKNKQTNKQTKVHNMLQVPKFAKKTCSQ